MTQGIQEEHPGFRLRQDRGILVVTFTGPKIPPDAGDPLYRLVEGEGHGKLVINLENVRVLTSSPIAVLVNLGRKAAAAGGAVRLCRLDPDIREALRLTHTESLFEIFDDEPGAVASLAS